VPFARCPRSDQQNRAGWGAVRAFARRERFHPLPRGPSDRAGPDASSDTRSPRRSRGPSRRCCSSRRRRWRSRRYWATEWTREAARLRRRNSPGWLL